MPSPIHYKTIPTQYAFLVSKTDKGYQVQVQALRDLTPQQFATKKEVTAFINQERII